MNRVGESYVDQLELSGHAGRLADLDLLASLGVSAIRYPVLWERVAPDGLHSADWRWSDSRLARLRELGVTPIVGLVHHGSGPRDTSLLDPLFASKLAAYARAVAERYPWISMVTPVNEPLTTARFSGLYGHWYPHRHDSRSFARMLMNQCLGVRDSMRAMRAVNPDVQLVQTDDLGHVHSRKRLRYQADFENERRWLTFDLLSGRVDRSHALWHHLLRWGISERELASLADDPCPPDVVGVNHYLTSERFLDDRVKLYPPHLRGGNGIHHYADVEAVRACADRMIGAAGLLTEAWQRYRIPVAMTEVHLGCTPDEQLRWLQHMWSAALEARDAGCNVRAVTPWAAFGSFGWDELVTRADGRYEPGIFDVRSDPPRPTPLAEMVRSLARTGGYAHPDLDTPGWWAASPERAASA